MIPFLAVGCIILAIIFSWPWVDPYLIRHDASARILRALDEEWKREAEGRREDPWNW